MADIDVDWVDNSPDMHRDFSKQVAAAEAPETSVEGTLDVNEDSVVYMYPADPFEPGAELQEDPPSEDNKEGWVPIEKWGGVRISSFSPKDHLDGAAIIFGGPRFYPQGANGREELAHSIAMTQDLGDDGLFYKLAVDYNGPFEETITSLGVGLDLDPIPHTGGRVIPRLGLGIDYGYKGNIHNNKAFFDNMIVPYGEIGAKTKITEHVFIETGCKTVPEGGDSEDFDFACQVGAGYEF